MHISVHALGLFLTFALTSPLPEPSAVPTTAPSAGPVPTSFVPIRGQFGPGPKHKVRFDQTEFETLDWLRASGAIEAEEDYGSFVIAVVDEEDFGGREALQISELTFRDDYDLLPLSGYVLNGALPSPVLESLDPPRSSVPAITSHSTRTPDSTSFSSAARFERPGRKTCKASARASRNTAR